MSDNPTYLPDPMFREHPQQAPAQQRRCTECGEPSDRFFCSDDCKRAAFARADPARHARRWVKGRELEVFEALKLAESALAVKASLRDGEQARCQRALEAVRAALRTGA